MYEDRMPEGYKSARECAIDEQDAYDWALADEGWPYEEPDAEDEEE
jgi:hypothetical protein